MIRYSKKMTDYLLNNYEGKSNIALAKEMSLIFKQPIDATSISNKKAKLKSKGYKFKKAINDGKFKKGSISHNKGKKWDEYMPKDSQRRSMKTTFKKNNIPINHRPVGSERINVDGYIEIKVAEPKKWELKHRFIYKQFYGEIPEDHVIIFLDGNKLNVSIDNLVLINQHQNLILNKKKLRSNNITLMKASLLITQMLDRLYEIKEKGRKKK